MKVQGKVSAVSGNSVLVDVVREGACAGNCASCAGCAGKTVRVKALCHSDVSVGSVVEISTPSAHVFTAMFLLFLLPVILPILGYLLCYPLHRNFAIIVAALLFALSLFCIYRLSKTERFLRRITPLVMRVLD